jgi:hypothetical protein
VRVQGGGRKKENSTPFSPFIFVPVHFFFFSKKASCLFKGSRSHRAVRLAFEHLYRVSFSFSGIENPHLIPIEQNSHYCEACTGRARRTFVLELRASMPLTTTTPSLGRLVVRPLGSTSCPSPCARRRMTLRNSQRVVTVAATRPSSSSSSQFARRRQQQQQQQVRDMPLTPSDVPPPRRSPASTAWWDALDVTATLGAVAGALAFVVTQEVSFLFLVFSCQF